MKIKKIFIICLIFLGIPQALSAQTLEDYLKIAAKNNPALKSSFAEFEAALQRIAQVNALPDPNLSLGVFLSPIETRNGPQQSKISLTQMFPWFGTLKIKGEIATLQAETKFQEFNHVKYKLFYQVKEAWYPLRELYRIIELQERNKKILTSLKQLATTSFKNGKGTMVDVIRVDIMLKNSEMDIKLLRDKKKPLLTRFNNLLNRPDSIEVIFPDTLDISMVIAGYRRDSLFDAHPILQSMKLKLGSAKAQEELAIKEGLPGFGLGIDYLFVGKRTDLNPTGNGRNAIMPIVTMSIPIYRRKYHAAIREAQLNQEAISYKIESLENDLTNKYELIWYEMNNAFQLLTLHDTQIEKINQAIRLLSTAYHNSDGDFEEILRMQQELLKYQIAQANAEKKYQTALAKLDYLTTKNE